MRNVIVFLAASSFAFSSTALAQEPAAPAPPPVVTPAPVVPVPERPQSILYVHEDGTPVGLPEAPKQIRSRGMVIGGVTSGVVGLALLIGGVVLASAAADKPPCSDADLKGVTLIAGGAGAAACTLANGLNDAQRIDGYLMAGLGAAAVVTGTVLTLTGVMPVKPTREQMAKGVPAVSVGAGSATLKWTF